MQRNHLEFHKIISDTAERLLRMGLRGNHLKRRFVESLEKDDIIATGIDGKSYGTLFEDDTGCIIMNCWNFRDVRK